MVQPPADNPHVMDQAECCYKGEQEHGTSKGTADTRISAMLQ